MDPIDNDYYRDAFRHLTRIVRIEALIIGGLSLALLYVMIDAHSEDRYFARTLEGRQMQMISLSRPNLSETALSDWVAQATMQIMTFGFNDINQRFEVSRHNFTAEGWKSFYKAMIDSGLAETVLKSQQLVTAVPLGPPLLVQEGMNATGKYTRVYELQILITFRSGSAQKVNPKQLRVVVEPVPTADNPNGIGISEWYMY